MTIGEKMEELNDRIEELENSNKKLQAEKEEIENLNKKLQEQIDKCKREYGEMKL